MLDFSLLLRSSVQGPNISEYAFCRFSSRCRLASHRDLFLGGDRHGKGFRGVIWHYWKWEGKAGWNLDGGANTASIFVFGTDVFQNWLNRCDEFVGLFAIATVKDVAFQCCRVSFELIHWKAKSLTVAIANRPKSSSPRLSKFRNTSVSNRNTEEIFDPPSRIQTALPSHLQ